VDIAGASHIRAFAWHGTEEDAVVPALEATSLLVHVRVREGAAQTVGDRRAWARLLERLDVDPADQARGGGAAAAVPSRRLADAFRDFVAAAEGPFDDAVLRRAPGAQLLMLGRLEHVELAAIAGVPVASGRHARAGFAAFATGRLPEAAALAPGPRFEGAGAEASAGSTVAAAVQAALAAFEAPGRIGFGATREGAVAAWLRACGVRASAPPRLGAGPTFAALDRAFATGRAIALRDGENRVAVAWARDGAGDASAWSALALRSRGRAPPCDETVRARAETDEATRARVRARLETRHPWREANATCRVVPWWDLPPPLVAPAAREGMVAWRIDDEDVSWFALSHASGVDAYDLSGAPCACV
jgi:hypothetical protein